MIDFIDLFSGIGGFRLGLERANQEVREYLSEEQGGDNLRSFGNSAYVRKWSRQQMGRENIENCREIGLERANFSTHEEIENGNASSRGTDFEEKCKPQLSTRRFRCVWSCDNNKYANQVYTKQFGEANHHAGDIRGVNAEEIPDFDLLCAGFPCQAFSVAGKRKGFEDTRGTLFFEICRIAEAKRPPLLLLENVRGLLSHDKGLTFQVILESLEELGYWAEWQVLNSKYFGVPQNRQRVFLVGHLGGRGGREIFPVGEADEMAQGEDERKREQISLAIDRNYWKGPDKHGQRTVIGVPRKRAPYGNKQSLVLHNLYGGFKEGIRVFDKNSPTIRTAKGGGHIPSVVILADRTRTLAGKGRNLESPKQITNALSSVQKDNLLLENMRIRRLTPVECERLQGYPDGWTEYGYVKDAVLDYEPVYGWKEKYDEETDEWEEYWTVIGKNPIDPITNTVRISDTQRYKALGNAVTTNVVEFLGSEILRAWIKI